MPQVRFLTPWYFNSQPHEEADRRNRSVRLLARNFNSQPHEEADVRLSLSSYSH